MASTGEVWKLGHRPALDGVRGIAVPTLRGLAVLVAVVAAAQSAKFYLAALPPIWFGDTDWYVTSLPALWGDAPLYPPQWLEDHVASRPDVAFNLPPAAAIFGPVAAMGRTTWGLLMAGCVVAALVVLWPRHLRPLRGILLACMVAGSWPVVAAVAWANLNSLVLLLFAVAWRWPRQSGWALGAAAAIKVAPIFALAVLIGRRDWRQLGAAIGTGAALTAAATAVTDWRAPWHFLLVQMHETHPEGMWRYSAADVIPEPWPLLLAVALGGIAVRRGGSWGWAVAACLVAVPTLHHHYLTWLLVPALGWVGQHFSRTANAGVDPRVVVPLPAAL